MSDTAIASALRIARKYANGGAVNTNPSMAQRKAGNYKMRHTTFQGLPITIENPKGTIRKGIDHTGKKWATRMTEDYGYIKGTSGHDGDHVDCFIGPDKKSDRVFVIDQIHNYGKDRFDEHKCMLGFKSKKKAFKAYKKSYGPSYGSRHEAAAMTEMSVDAFKEWLKGGGGKKPLAPDVPKYQDGGSVRFPEAVKKFRRSQNVEDWRYMKPLDESIVDKTPPDISGSELAYQAGIADIQVEPPEWIPPKGWQWKQEGGAVDDSDVGFIPGAEGMQPVAQPPPPERPPATERPMEPTLQEAQMGQQELPEGLAVNEAGEVFRKDTGEVIPVARRPSVLPLYRTAEGQIAPAMPKALDIIGSMGGGWGVPVAGAEAVLGAGLAKGVKAAAAAPKTAETIGKKVFDLPPEEVKAALQTSGTKGTSAGGIFTGFSDGVDRYVKIAKSLDHAKEEVLASKLYQLAGVRAANTELTMLNGKPAVASQMIPDTLQLSEFEPHQYSGIAGLKEDFPAHAWLANWDAPGVGSENPLGNILVDGKWNAHYVDFGGAMRYRGLGGEKGDLFGNKVTETKLMLGPTAKNPLVASVFEGHAIGPDSPVAQRIANISDKDIWDLVNQYGPAPAAERGTLANKLIARRDDLASQYGITPSEGFAAALEKGKVAFPKETAPPHIVGGTDYEKLQAEWEAKLAQTPTEYAPEFSELSGYPKPEPTPVTEEYSFKNAQADADKLTENHVMGFDPVEGDYNYNTAGIAHDMYNMAMENPEYVDEVFHKLPDNVYEDVHKQLSQLVQAKGDPWVAHEIAAPKAATAPAPGTGIGGTVKLMNLKKTHSVDDIVKSISAYNINELNVGKTITEKQKGKVQAMISAAPSQQIANSIKGLDAADQANVLSWLPAAKASNVKTLAKVGPEKAAQPIPDIDKITKGHSLYQILNAIKNYSPLQAEVPYHAYQSIPKEISKFSPAEIMKEMEPLSLAQKQKIMKWLPETTQEKMAQLGAAQQAKKKGFIPQEYYDALEPLNWQAYKPKGSTSLKQMFSKTMLQHILDLGYNPDVALYKGGKYADYPQTILDPVTEPHRLSNPQERAFFLTHEQHGVAGAYGTVGKPYVARPAKTFVVHDWRDLTGSEDYSSHHMIRLIEAAREKGADLLVVHNVGDVAEGGHKAQTQYAFLNTHVLRGPEAKFDPAKLHLRYPLAGLVGGGLFTYGTLRGQEADQYAAGGAVTPRRKIERDAFLYLNPKPPKDQFAQCGTCLMFTGTGCTILGKTKITKDMTCGLYVRGKPQYNLKGKEQSLVTPKEAGLIDSQVRCENCRYGGKNCQLFEMLNDQMPDDFDLDTKIDPKGCCNAFKKGG